MKTRKTVIAVLSAVLLISAALIVGCIGQFEGASIKEAEEDNFVVPKRKGLIKFKINDGRARTIMPTADLDTMHFKFIFIDSDTVTGPHTITWPVSGTVEYSSSISIYLPEETYTVDINAYSDSDGNSAHLITSWSSGATTYQVNTNTSTPIDAYLTGDVTSGANGKFNYHITIPNIAPPAITDLDNYTKTLTILTHDDSTEADLFEADGITPVTNPIILDAADGINFNADDIVLDAGQYYVYVKLTADHCQDRVIKNVMYIYRNLPTNYGTSDDSIEVPHIVQNEFTVRFHSGTTPDNGVTGGSFTGGIMDIIYNNAEKATNPFSSPTHNDYTFVGWFKEPGYVNGWNWNTLIFKDTEIYAYWQAIQGMDVTIHFDILDGGINAIVPDGNNPVGSFSYDAIAGNSASVVLKFTTSLTSASWNLDGVPLAATQTSIPNDTLTISKTSNSSILNRLASGTHIINLKGNDTNSKPQSAQVVFTVDNN